MSETEEKNYIVPIVNLILGLFFLIISPFLVLGSLSLPLDRLVNVYQVQQPNGFWKSPVEILTATYHVWMVLIVYTGAFLIILAKFIYEKKEWAYATSITLYAIPSIGGMTMFIPWIVLVWNGPVPGTTGDISSEYGLKGAGMAPAIWIMLLGLVGYYIVLFTMPERRRGFNKQIFISKLTIFTLIGVLSGYSWMNAQHGVRYFLGRVEAPLIDPANSNPEMFLGGFLMYTTVLFYLIAIFLMASKKEAGIWIAIATTIITTSVNLIVFVDRIKWPSAMDWLRGALLSIILLVILLVPWFQKGILEDVD